jgi:hypothetical protein
VPELAAARTGMSVKTARRYERLGKMPSQVKPPRTWRTRENPFEEVWPWVVEQLERDSALQGATLFAELCQRHPGAYRTTQVRTLQRHIARLSGAARAGTGSDLRADPRPWGAGTIRLHADA